MNVYEFVVEYGKFARYIEVVAENAKAARQKVWSELTDYQRDNFSDIELIETWEAA